MTGCDAVSAFVGHGKKSAWAAWNSFPELTDSLVSLSTTPVNIHDDSVHCIERSVVLLYDRTSSLLIRTSTKPERNSLPRENPSSASHRRTMLRNSMWRDQFSRVAMSGGRSWYLNPFFHHQQAGAGEKQRMDPMNHTPWGFKKLLRVGVVRIQ